MHACAFFPWDVKQEIKRIKKKLPQAEGKQTSMRVWWSVVSVSFNPAKLHTERQVT
jgi:hypothetical protein